MTWREAIFMYAAETLGVTFGGQGNWSHINRIYWVWYKPRAFIFLKSVFFVDFDVITVKDEETWWTTRQGSRVAGKIQLTRKAPLTRWIESILLLVEITPRASSYTLMERDDPLFLLYTRKASDIEFPSRFTWQTRIFCASRDQVTMDFPFSFNSLLLQLPADYRYQEIWI